MKLLLVTDAWHPQVNGVVRTLEHTTQELVKMGYQIQVVHPSLFRTVPCPIYPEIRLAIDCGGKLQRIVDAHEPDAVHIATEGPLGLAARWLCVKRDWPFTASFHTRFAEYFHARIRLPVRLTYRAQRWFYRPASRVMVGTPSIERTLQHWGLQNTVPWTRGVDTELFRPLPDVTPAYPEPIYLCVGRLAVEKNLDAFLRLELPGTKLIVGDGPARKALQRRYPQAVFAGTHHGEALVRMYAQADVLVFPSLTDTFGLVLLEALACGVPIAAFPVPGPLDVIGNHPVGCLDRDLKKACEAALQISKPRCREFALPFSWSHCAALFASYLQPMHQSRRLIGAEKRSAATAL